MIVVKENKKMKEKIRPIQTNLTWYEISVAIHLVGLRHTESLRKGMQDKHGYKGRDMQDNFYGMLGEIAFAKITNKYFPMTVNTFKEADIGVNWQVRTVGSNKNRDLIIRPTDPVKHKYVLVEISKQSVVVNFREDNYVAIIHGWIEGSNGKHPQYLSNFGYPDRPKAYRIPKEELRSPSWIPV